MRAVTKKVSMLLCVLMVALLPLTALAGDVPSITQAMENGREVWFHGAMEWKMIPILLDEETNDLVTAVVDAIEIEGRMADLSDGSGFMDVALVLSGEDAVPFAVVYEGDTVYFNSPVYGKPFKLSTEDVEPFLMKVGTYLEGMDDEIPAGTFTAMYEQMFDAMDAYAGQYDDSIDIQEMSDEQVIALLKQAYAPYGMDGVMDVVMDWTENQFLAGAEEVPTLENVFGVQVDSAVVYPVTKDMLIELITDIVESLRDSDAFLALIAQNAQSTGMLASGGAQTDVEIDELRADFDEMLQELPEALDSIPDDFIASLAVGHDEDGNEVVTYLDVYVPAESEYDDDVVFYMEWVNGSPNFYMEVGVGSEGVTMTVQPNEPLVDGTPDNGFSAILTIFSGGDEMGNLILETSSIAQDIEDGRAWEGGLTAGMMMQGMDILVEGIASQVVTTDGEDVISDTNVDIDLIMYSATLPVISLRFYSETDEPGEAPFDIDAMAFIEPAKMSDAEFADWMTSVSAAMMKTALRVASLLPDEVIMMMMAEQMH